MIAAINWVDISSLATAGATLVLAVATFSSVRSGNRTARAAERALAAGLLPLIIPSRLDDPPQKVGFVDNRWLSVPGGRAVIELTPQVIYLAVAIRNAGNGLAVLHSWLLIPDEQEALRAEHGPLEQFTRLTRDLYIAPGEIGFWQGAFRHPSAEEFKVAREALDARHRVGLEILYGDHEGGQRTVTRFGLTPTDDGTWIAAVVRHWQIDGPSPR